MPPSPRSPLSFAPLRPSASPRQPPLVPPTTMAEGVLVAKKDFYKPKHDDVEVPNIQVMQLMKSLNSRGLVTQTFNWQYFYW